MAKLTQADLLIAMTEEWRGVYDICYRLERRTGISIKPSTLKRKLGPLVRLGLAERHRRWDMSPWASDDYVPGPVEYRRTFQLGRGA